MDLSNVRLKLCAYRQKSNASFLSLHLIGTETAQIILNVLDPTSTESFALCFYRRFRLPRFNLFVSATPCFNKDQPQSKNWRHTYARKILSAFSRIQENTHRLAWLLSSGEAFKRRL
jgi:hypothetical protein